MTGVQTCALPIWPSLLLASFPSAHCISLTIDLPLAGAHKGFPVPISESVVTHLGSIFRPEVLCPSNPAHIETAEPLPSYHFGHGVSSTFTIYKYHDPYDGSFTLAMCICPWRLGGCGYRLPSLSHCFTPFIAYWAFRGRDITNGYDSTLWCTSDKIGRAHV